jgi:uracil-DNA glycosylase
MAPQREQLTVPVIPDTWVDSLENALESESYRQLGEFLREQRAAESIFPPVESTFAALEMTPLDKVRVVVLGQDPYHDDGQAHGLSFSVPHGHRLPPSLRNIVKELREDIQEPVDATHGNLTAWAQQGVLLLNAVLTVRAHEANSHRGKGWEEFTDEVISAVSRRSEPAVFVLWGATAGKKQTLIDTKRHAIIATVHPSPLSARRGFFGSRPFSKINAQLREWGQDPIDWYLPWR